MAALIYPGNAKSIVSSGASDTMLLGDAGQSHAISRWIVSAVLAVGTGTIKPQKAITIVDPVAQPAYADCWYTDALANAIIAAGTTQSVTCVLDVIADGCDAKLVLTTAGGGTWTLICQPIFG